MKIIKVPLKKFIDLLIDVYNQGINYVDISGINGEGQDKIGISYDNSYFTKEYPIETKLTEELLNKLI